MFLAGWLGVLEWLCLIDLAVGWFWLCIVVVCGIGRLCYVDCWCWILVGVVLVVILVCGDSVCDRWWCCWLFLVVMIVLLFGVVVVGVGSCWRVLLCWLCVWCGGLLLGIVILYCVLCYLVYDWLGLSRYWWCCLVYVV